MKMKVSGVIWLVLSGSQKQRHTDSTIVPITLMESHCEGFVKILLGKQITGSYAFVH